MTTVKEKPKTIQATIRRDDLLIGLGLCHAVMTVRTSKPILACCKLSRDDNGIRIEATDLCVFVSYKIGQCEIDNWEDVAAPCAELHAIVAGMDDDVVRLSVDGEHLRIAGNHSDFKLFTSDPKEFPPRPEITTSAAKATLGASELARAIRQTGFAVSDVATKFGMTGVLFATEANGLAIAATDTRLMAEYRIPLISSKAACIVPPKALAVVGRLVEGSDEDAKILLGENQIAFELDGAEVISSLCEGAPSPYREAVLDKAGENEIELDRVALLNSVKHMSAIVVDDISIHAALKLEFGKSMLAISGNSPGRGECRTTMPIKSKSGKEVWIYLNCRRLIKLLSAAEGELIQLRLSDEAHPMILNDRELTGAIGAISPT